MGARRNYHFLIVKFLQFFTNNHFYKQNQFIK